MPTSLIQPEFKVEIDYDKCHKCGRCVQQCGWGVYSFNERPFPDDIKCRACHRCVTYCPAHCITIKKNDLALRENANWSSEQRKNVWRQAESGGVMLTGMGNDKPYQSIFDHLVLDACQVTNPSIDPLREPMELRTYLGRKPDSVEVESDGNGGFKPVRGRRHRQQRQARHADHLLADELRLGVAQRAQVAGDGRRASRHAHEHGRGRTARRPLSVSGQRHRPGRLGPFRRHAGVPAARRCHRDQGRPGRQAGHRRAPAGREDQQGSLDHPHDPAGLGRRSARRRTTTSTRSRICASSSTRSRRPRATSRWASRSQQCTTSARSRRASCAPVRTTCTSTASRAAPVQRPRSSATTSVSRSRSRSPWSTSGCATKASATRPRSWPQARFAPRPTRPRPSRSAPTSIAIGSASLMALGLPPVPGLPHRLLLVGPDHAEGRAHPPSRPRVGCGEARQPGARLEPRAAGDSGRAGRQRRRVACAAAVSACVPSGSMLRPARSWASSPRVCRRGVTDSDCDTN